jgi:hypothetical protein
MSVNDEENTNDLQPSPAERSEALLMVKKFAFDGYLQEAGTDLGFELLWRTAFSTENTEPDPNKATINTESGESDKEILSPSNTSRRGFQILPEKGKQQ